LFFEAVFQADKKNKQKNFFFIGSLKTRTNKNLIFFLIFQLEAQAWNVMMS